MSIARLVHHRTVDRGRLDLADAVEHYLAISRAAGLFASSDYYAEAEEVAWRRMIEALAVLEGLDPRAVTVEPGLTRSL
jgi:hypothetical protein